MSPIYSEEDDLESSVPKNKRIFDQKYCDQRIAEMLELHPYLFVRKDFKKLKR